MLKTSGKRVCRSLRTPFRLKSGPGMSHSLESLQLRHSKIVQVLQDRYMLDEELQLDKLGSMQLKLPDSGRRGLASGLDTLSTNPTLTLYRGAKRHATPLSPVPPILSIPSNSWASMPLPQTPSRRSKRDAANSPDGQLVHYEDVMMFRNVSGSKCGKYSHINLTSF